jgi:hypothetical protein
MLFIRPHSPPTSMSHFAITVLLALVASSATAAAPICAGDAAEQARKLLAFHVGEGFEDRMSFEPPSPKKSIKNPANSKQILKILEVEGFVSPHGRYRMRLIFHTLPRGCLLMGQEILEIANL